VNFIIAIVGVERAGLPPVWSVTVRKGPATIRDRRIERAFDRTEDAIYAASQVIEDYQGKEEHV
jgi:hypothetical protein